MAYGDAFSETLPTVKTTPGDDYAVEMNALVQAMKTRLETQVDQSGIAIAGTFELNSNALAEVTRITFDNLTAAPGLTRGIYFQDGEFYVDDGSSNVVQITSSGSLNVGSVTGVNGSGYGSGGVEILWVSGSSLYKLKDASGANAFADIQIEDVLVTNVTSGYAVSLKAPAGMAANYDFTLPAAAPAADAFLQMDTSGVVTASDTHGDRVLTIPPCAAHAPDSTLASLSANGGKWEADSGSWGSTGGIMFPINLRYGDRIKSIRYDQYNGSAGSITWRLYVEDYSGGPNTVTQVDTDIDPGSGYQNGDWVPSTLVILGGTEAASPLVDCYAWLKAEGTHTDDEIYGVQVTYDRV